MVENTNLTDLEPFILNLDKLKRKDLALEVLNVFANVSMQFKEYDNIAKCYFKIKDYTNAMKYGEIAMTITSNPQEKYIARHNLINIYNHANYPEKAMRYIKQSEAVIEKDIDIVLEKAYSHFLLNEKDKAEEILQKVLNEDIENLSEEYITKIKFNLGTYYMLRDEFQTGLRLFLEEGAKMKFWNTESIFARNNNLNLESLNGKLKANTFKKWDGIPRPGKPIIIHAEAGIGDEIINFRFMKTITDMGMIPYWYNSYPERSDILDVFARQGFNVLKRLTDLKEEGDIYYAQSMHLPVIMNLEYKDLWWGPYIKSNPEFVNKWSNIKSNKLKIGIRWQGNPFYDHDLHRSVNLSGIYNSIKHLDANFYSLQKDTGLEELTDFPELIDLSDKLNSWEDTLAVIENLDIVITTCTSVAHAAAAMGKKTFVFVPISSYYVWCHTMDQSPWYGDNVKLFRQKKPRVWDEPLNELSIYINTLYHPRVF